ncbi:MAG: DMT family transporter [Clostridia bacterium]|nr:DMT family transporter [Clostridia bacterium]
MQDKARKTLFPLLASLIWGTSFAIQSFNYTGAFTFISIRNLVAFFFTLLLIFIFRKKGGRSPFLNNGKFDKRLIIGGILCGTALAFASFFQQLGIDNGTESGKAAFITAMYIVFVPILGIFIKKHTPKIAWFCIFLGIIGLYLLCVTDGFSIKLSDIYVLICSVLFALHILLLDYFTPVCDNFKLSNLQFLTTCLITFVFALFTEKFDAKAISDSLFAIFYLGIFSSGVAYTLQVFAQKDANPALTALLLSMESLFGVISSAIILGEVLTLKEYTGCAVMFIAVIICSMPEKFTKTNKVEKPD